MIIDSATILFHYQPQRYGGRMRLFFVIAALLMPLGHVDADEMQRIPWDKLTSGQKAALIGTTPLLVHQAPFVVTHEGSHWLTAAVFGRHPKLSLMPGWVSSGGSQVLAGAYVNIPDQDMSDTEKALITIAPVVTKLVIVDRGIEAMYRHGTLRPGTFADRYVLAGLQFAIGEPVTGIIPQSDIGQFAKATGLPRVPVSIAIQGAYAYSYYRITKARHGAYVPIFYIHLSF